MRALFFLFGLLGLGRSAAFAQPIPWSSERLLTWDDFQYTSKPKRFDAATCALLLNKFDYCKRDSVHCTVTAVFSPLLSWKKHNNAAPSLLKHEQVHFDIVELYARRLRKEMSQPAAARQSPRTQQWYEDACKRTTSQIHRCQRRYDRQTRHSRRRNAQERWNRKVADGLEELRVYVQ